MAQEKPLTDAASRTALTKFEASLRKKYASSLEPLGNEELAALEEQMRAWQGVGEFLDTQRTARLADADVDFDVPVVKGKAAANKTPARRSLKASTSSARGGGGRKGAAGRRSVSVAPTESSIDDDFGDGMIRRSSCVLRHAYWHPPEWLVGARSGPSSRPRSSKSAFALGSRSDSLLNSSV